MGSDNRRPGWSHSVSRFTTDEHNRKCRVCVHIPLQIGHPVGGVVSGADNRCTPLPFCQASWWKEDMPKPRLSMRNLREVVLRLAFDAGLSEWKIATTCSVSRGTVALYLARASELGLSWPLPENVSDVELERVSSSRQRREAGCNTDASGLDDHPQRTQAAGRNPATALERIHRDLPRELSLQLRSNYYG